MHNCSNYIEIWKHLIYIGDETIGSATAFEIYGWHS
jgi:hypothetical protein